MGDTELSLKLYNILDSTWLSEASRRQYREFASISEIPGALTRKSLKKWYGCSDPFRHFIFGSSFEGSTIPCLRSDFDHVWCDVTLPVVEYLEEAPQKGDSLLILRDDFTRPGYVKLQPVCDKKAGLLSDKLVGYRMQMDRILKLCFNHQKFVNGKRNYTERHGPADTISEVPGQIFSYDQVFSVRGNKIPSFANAWLIRRRKWPTKEMLQILEHFGVFFVGVGHPKSHEQHLEWRLSFSIQERVLMSNLNQTQFICYVLLKLIKKTFKEQITVGPITSYHLKTSLFHTIETTGSEVWTPDFLIKGTQLCLIQLLQYVKNRTCPNYFIPEENMFDRLSPDDFTNIYSAFKEILSLKLGLFQRINFDIIMETIKYGLSIKIYRIPISIIWAIYDNRDLFMKFIQRYKYPDNDTSAISILNDSLMALQRSAVFEDYAIDEVTQANATLIPHIHLLAVMILVSSMFRNGRTDLDPNVFYHLKAAEKADMMSSKLLLASIYLHLEKYGECEVILLGCCARIKELHANMCRCHSFMHVSDSVEYKITSKQSFGEAQETCITGCILFLPAHEILVHQSLKYEMFRSQFAALNTKEILEDDWFDWIVIDSKVYLYFLLYLLYIKTNRPERARVIVEKLVDVVRSEQLGHRDTAYNLLGWVSIRENREQEAIKFFLMSWKERPDHNASKWHLAVLLYARITGQQIDKYIEC